MTEFQNRVFLKLARLRKEGTAAELADLASKGATLLYMGLPLAALSLGTAMGAAGYIISRPDQQQERAKKSRIKALKNMAKQIREYEGRPPVQLSGDLPFRAS